MIQKSCKHQLRLVVCPTIYRVLGTSRRWLALKFPEPVKPVVENHHVQESALQAMDTLNETSNPRRSRWGRKGVDRVGSFDGFLGDFKKGGWPGSPDFKAFALFLGGVQTQNAGILLQKHDDYNERTRFNRPSISMYYVT